MLTHQEEYENLLNSISNGKKPNTVGLVLSQIQINEIETLLNTKKKEIDNYFEFVIQTRLDNNA